MKQEQISKAWTGTDTTRTGLIPPLDTKKQSTGIPNGMSLLCFTNEPGYFTAMASISTKASLGSCATAKQDLAGLVATKYWE